MKTAYHYKPGAVRWRRHDGKGDVRGYRPATGWEARAEILESHPVTEKPFPKPQWWLREQYVGDTA